MGWAIALHGGAGDIPLNLPQHEKEGRETALQHCLDIGVTALKAAHSPLDVVELVVRELENHPLFNAGRGSVLNTEGNVEMEACIMDGNTKKCGAVSGLKTVVNAVSLARLVMEKTPHIYLGFEGAEAFAKEQGVETQEPSHFITPANIERLKQAKEANRVQLDYTQPIQNDVKIETHNVNGDSQLGTVGCVAVDGDGNLAAATSTGGFVNKMVGRIGDTPIIGAGTYANTFCAVSATGKGEDIIRGTIARDVAALMEYKHLSLKEATAYVLENGAPQGSVGLIAVSAAGEIAMPFNTTGMFRASATQDGYSQIAIH
ncbi:hypothetical protein BVRB_5g113530 [Beta vulgaris subsp. vulgaris]|uniref:beta-aspartyl-peptidase n=1 Tax=Beta vulgaris subsp. vulgaris TaxID=3555 RepID=A0A0J8CB59_BETVV|nr:hypothetical protein BVRB_5g113530 [Beta vulgaris subsp. vulgaris]